MGSEENQKLKCANGSKNSQIKCKRYLIVPNDLENDVENDVIKLGSNIIKPVVFF